MIEEIFNNFPFYKLSILKNLLIEDQIWFKKSRSQNFLIDKNYIKKIYYAMLEDKGKSFIEIGGGSGNISVVLCTLAKKLIVIEIDKYFYQLLNKIFSLSAGFSNSISNYLYQFSKDLQIYTKDNSKEIYILNEDFLIMDFSKFLKDEKYVFFGNIPYNISTSIIMKLVKLKENIDKIYLTTQKEYYERLNGKNEKSFLTIYLSYHFIIRKLFDIPSSSFYPVPKVNSTFFYLLPKKSYYSLENERIFFDFVSKSFSKKRKKLLNNFKDDKNYYSVLIDIFQSEKINENIRAEDLTLEDFIKIFDIYLAQI
ncbi:MAG: 16S rRNA (adenine(1518)-N(6)/adenine(1519)-N(6))-dimethyltransferase RsmA [Exilispira sp.]